MFFKEIEIMDKNLLAELEDHIENPPGGDNSLSLFYSAVYKLYMTQNPLALLIHRVKKKRTTLTDKHLTNLLFRAYQYIKFESGDISYRNFKTKREWTNEISGIVKDSNKRRVFERILVKKSTQTTIYQRYVGPYVIMAKLLFQKPIKVADIGCGGNYGLRGMELFEPFRDITDLTPERQVTELLSKRVEFKKGLAIDKENPDIQRVRKWRMACSFYPIELELLNEVSLFEERIKKSIKVKFLKANLLTMEKMPKAKFDVIIMSMILYELTQDEQIILIDKMKKSLKSGGIIIVQDFAAKDKLDPSLLDYNVSWFGSDFGFRTFVLSSNFKWCFKEILKWNNGRCSVVKAGEDYKLIFKD